MAQTATVVGVVTLLYILLYTICGHRVPEVCLYLEYEGHSMEIEILQWRISLQSNQIDRSMPHLCIAFLMLALTSSVAHVCTFGCKAAAAVCSSFRKMGVQELIGSRRIHDLSLDVNDSFQLCSTMFNYVQLCSTMFNYVQLCSTMFNYVQLWSTMVNYGQLWSTMFNYVQLCSTLLKRGDKPGRVRVVPRAPKYPKMLSR